MNFPQRSFKADERCIEEFDEVIDLIDNGQMNARQMLNASGSCWIVEGQALSVVTGCFTCAI